MNNIVLETIKTPNRYADVSLSKEKVKEALDYVIKKIDENLETFTYKFLSCCTENKIYSQTENTDWTESFWTGMIWLAYELTGDEKYRKVGDIHVESFRNRIDNNISVDHHDLGFLYTLSCVACYKLTGSEFAKETALKAADKLITRYKEKGEFIQAWGDINDPKAYRLIIDCMMNLPLLYWASDVTGDSKYYDLAYKHAKTTAQNIVREDASTFHTFYFDHQTGAPLEGVTHQGFSDDSCWARGQAWGVYGFALSYIYTKDEIFKDLYKKVTNYFINRLPEDFVAYWDLIFTDGSGEERDSSAAAIAVCGMLEFDRLEHDELYKNAAFSIVSSMIDNYTTKGIASNGVLDHSVYHKKGGRGVDECCTWGDYYYMEALARLYKDWKMYW